MKRKEISPDKPIKVVYEKNCTLFERWGEKESENKKTRPLWVPRQYFVWCSKQIIKSKKTASQALVSHALYFVWLFLFYLNQLLCRRRRRRNRSRTTEIESRNNHLFTIYILFSLLFLVFVLLSFVFGSASALFWSLLIVWV